MDAVVGWQVKGRLAAVARIMVRREGGRGAPLALYERGRREGLEFAEELFRNIWSAPLSVFIPFSLSHSALVSLSLLLPHIHSLV